MLASKREALLALLLALGCASPQGEELAFESRGCDSCGGACQEDFLPSSSRENVDGDIDYVYSPPAGGDHNACWSPWGVHLEEVPPERWVHNLELGGVVFLYSCPEGCAAEVSTLSEYVSSLPPGRALLSPYRELPAPYRFAAISWEHRLLLGCLDPGALDAFFEERVARAPENATAPSPQICNP